MATKLPFVLNGAQVQQVQAGDLVDPVAGGVPTGTILPFAGWTVPAGYLLCDGTAYSTTTYAALYNALTLAFTCNTTNGSPTITTVSPAINTANWCAGMVVLIPAGYGAPVLISSLTSTTLTLNTNMGATLTGTAGVLAPWTLSGLTSFHVPDLRGRATIGTLTGSGLTARYLGVTAARKRTLSLWPSCPATVTIYRFRRLPDRGATLPIRVVPQTKQPAITASTGSGTAHNNMPPWAGVQWIIKT